MLKFHDRKFYFQEKRLKYSSAAHLFSTMKKADRISSRRDLKI